MSGDEEAHKTALAQAEARERAMREHYHAMKTLPVPPGLRGIAGTGVPTRTPSTFHTGYGGTHSVSVREEDSVTERDYSKFLDKEVVKGNKPSTNGGLYIVLEKSKEMDVVRLMSVSTGATLNVPSFSAFLRHYYSAGTLGQLMTKVDSAAKKDRQ